MEKQDSPNNCFICAKEFDSAEVSSKFAALTSKVKICQGCLENSNSSEDYKQVKEVIAIYSFPRSLFDELKDDDVL